MAAALELRHWVVSEVSSYYYGNYGRLSDDNIDLIADTAKNIILNGDQEHHGAEEL
jgi:hypothetical protein